MKTTVPLWKALNGALMLGLLILPANLRPSYTIGESECKTQTVRLTLAGEQIQFCAPSSVPFTTSKDNLTIPRVSYGGLSQVEGYASFNIRAAEPGAQPGTGLPVHARGGVEVYRQAVRSQATAQKGRISAAPAAILWGEKVAGLQIDYALPADSGSRALRVIEWAVERNGRLWDFSFTWDQAILNSGEWQSAAEQLVIETASAGLPDTAIDLGRAFQSTPPTPPGIGKQTTGGGPVDMPLPAWWAGDICDDGNYFESAGIHAVSLGQPWHGVYACGTDPLNAMVNVWVQFYPGAWGQIEWQCVELANRFLYLEWSIPPIHGNAREMKDNLPATMVFYANDGTHPIVPGDILIDEGKNAYDSGHAMVIKGTHFGAGGEYVDILEQNSSSGGSRSIHITDGIVDDDAWAWGREVQGWLHVKANTASGDADPGFALTGAGLNGPVTALGLQSTGKLIVAGEFTGYDVTPRNHLARLNANGTLDASFDTSTGIEMTAGTVQVNALNVQADEKILLGGYFDHYNGAARASFARLNGDGTLDTAFNALTTGITKTDAILGDIPAPVEAIAIQPADGMILVGGDFDKYNGTARHFLARLSGSDGSVDAAFNPNPGGKVYALAVQADGKILVGGDFPGGLLRLNPDCSADAGFNPAPAVGANAVVKSIALQEDKIYIAGTFTTYNGTSRSGIARLTSSGALDTTFNPGTGIGGTTPELKTVLPQPDGRILIGGKFATYNGTPAFNFLRLNNDGTRDTTFLSRGDYSSTDVDKYVRPILLQPDGKIVIGGQFAGRIVRLLNEILPCYSLAVQAAPVSGGTVTVSPLANCPGGKYISGSSILLTASPTTAQEFIFTHWSGDASGSSNPLGVTLTADKSITANFLDPPHAFSKAAPTNGASNQPSTLSLSWNSSPGAATYEYCLNAVTVGQCNNEAAVWPSAGSNTSVQVNNLLPSVTYYWNVRAVNAAGSTFSNGGAWTFHRNANPAVPVLLFPTGNIVVPQPFYRWNESPGATSYQLVVEWADGTPILTDETVPASACAAGVCSIQPSVDLALGDYHFKVKALTSGGDSGYSAWMIFSVRIGTFLPVIRK